MIQFFFENITPLSLPPSVDGWLSTLISTENKKVGNINYIFCDDQYLLQINQGYLSHDHYTDIITFDYVKGKIISGDIFVSLPRISENAEIHSQPFDRELLRVVAHGVLHLCGYKDKTPDEAALMREKEEFYLDRLEM